MQILPTAFNALAEYSQFILWRMIDGKKLPVSPYTLDVVSAHDRAHWVDAQTAISCAATCKDCGVAFVFTSDDPFFFVDIDKCLLDGGQWSDIAVELMTQFTGAAIEVSQSGRGLHIIAKGAPIPHGCKNIQLGIEYYTEQRFVALTGQNIVGDAGTDHSQQLALMTTKYFAPGASADFSSFDWTQSPVDNWTGPTDNEKLIERATKSKSAAGILGGRATFADLWTANAAKLSQFYPHDSKPFDESSADAALASHLAFWTGKNCERMRDLMQLSGLKRKKYERDDYLIRTIANACALCRDVLGASVEPVQPVNAIAETTVAAISNAPIIKTGYQFLAGAMQADYFKGCVYIRGLHRVLTPSGEILKPDQFKATFGGYVFALDADGEKTTKNAFEAFTESQAVQYPQASNGVFRPDLAPGQLVESDGLTCVNTYYPAHVATLDGDPSPFLEHLAKLLPDARDREILLSYLAACVQHKGVKFQWCPLIQGVEGNGKTLFTRVVRYALGRKFVHFPKADDLDNKFNSWLDGKLLIGVEDIYISEDRAALWETLKPMITGGDGIEIQYKGADQFTADICANFILNSNHKDAVKKTENDRRLAPFYTAQQSAGDLARDGMSEDYFGQLYNWLNADGYAITAHYLENYKIAFNLNPAGGCNRAPKTSSTAEAISAGQGRIEGEILEAIDEGRPGFIGGWVSSKRLDDLLEHSRASKIIPRNKRRAMMQSLGFDYHPALNDGRVNNVIITEGGKPRLYIKNDHISRNLKTCADVVKAYEKAQAGQTIDEQGNANNA